MTLNSSSLHVQELKIDSSDPLYFPEFAGAARD